MTAEAPTILYSLERVIEPEQVQALLRQTTWAKDRTREGLEAMLARPDVFVGAWEDDRLVGFARAITDGAYRALVDDVVVDESARGRGIGDELVRRLVDALGEVDEVFLRCQEGLVPFYERHGFTRARCVTMDKTSP